MSDNSSRRILKGKEALLEWCRRQTRGYPNVKIRDMDSSWRDGLAFCAIIHHFRPDLIDFNSLSKHEMAKNNELAFKVAEMELGIPRLLDVCDMIEMEILDNHSIMTYVSLYYQHFKDKSTATMTKVKHRQGLHSSSLEPQEPRSQEKPKRYLMDVLCNDS